MDMTALAGSGGGEGTPNRPTLEGTALQVTGDLLQWDMDVFLTNQEEGKDLNPSFKNSDYFFCFLVGHSPFPFLPE